MIGSDIPTVDGELPQIFIEDTANLKEPIEEYLEEFVNEFIEESQNSKSFDSQEQKNDDLDKSVQLFIARETLLVALETTKLAKKEFVAY